MAYEVWGDPLPESWKSALRNRMTRARRVLGADAIVNDASRFTLADHVYVDTWHLLQHDLDGYGSRADEFGFLDGDPFVDIDPSPLLQLHATRVAEARAALVETAVAQDPHLSPRSIQGLRDYHRRHPLDPKVSLHAVEVHLRIGDLATAGQLVSEIRAASAEAALGSTVWVSELEQLVAQHPAMPSTTTPTNVSAEQREAEPRAEEQHEADARAELFATAARNEEWSVALEIAMHGLPGATRSGGDPSRLALLEAIPLDKLDPSRQFSYCMTTAQYLMFAGRESEALELSIAGAQLASNPDEEMVAYLTAAIVGGSHDERLPLPLPDAFDKSSNETVTMQSLQVAVISHLERASFAESAALHRRFDLLVEASADPYRRWHMLLLGAMALFVDGHLDASADAAVKACKYAKLFGIADAKEALVGHLANAHWAHPGFAVPDGLDGEDPSDAAPQTSKPLLAVAAASHDGGRSVNEFIRSHNWQSRSFFSFPAVVVAAPFLTDPELRRQIAQRLTTRSDTSVIWGSGVMHLGPIDRVLAQLVEPATDKHEHLLAAQRVADDQRTRLWQVICRLDLAGATGQDTYRHEASELATTAELRQLLQEYEGVVERLAVAD